MKVKTATFLTSATDLASCPSSDLPEFAFIGRSNVGKSTLLNMLANKEALARVSSSPGHTELINFFTMNGSWSLVDLPGYGYAKGHQSKQHKFESMILEYLTGRTTLACIFVLIDARHAPQVIDVKFVQWLMGYITPVILVFTKTDKVKSSMVSTNIELFKAKIAAWSVQTPKIICSSSVTRLGRLDILQCIEENLTKQ